jgi:hypothetical protein
VQWFERARFEQHPENPPPHNVLLGLLGNEVHGPAAPPSLPPPAGQLALDGTWNGTTSQGKPISFVIRQHGLASFSIGFSNLGCGFAARRSKWPAPSAEFEPASNIRRAWLAAVCA